MTESKDKNSKASKNRIPACEHYHNYRSKFVSMVTTASMSWTSLEIRLRCFCGTKFQSIAFEASLISLKSVSKPHFADNRIVECFSKEIKLNWYVSIHIPNISMEDCKYQRNRTVAVQMFCKLKKEGKLLYLSHFLY